MKLFVVKEGDGRLLQSHPQSVERRCGMTPATVKKFKLAKVNIGFEKGAGELAGFSDQEYIDAGAEPMDRAAGLSSADVVFYVGRPKEADLAHLNKGTLVVGHLDPFFQQELVEDMQNRGLSLISVEMIPRSTRSQKMDALSSQTNLSGYVMVLNAASELNTLLPMMMTPAGTVKPAKVFVIGAGVAGLQAIATAKRLGASVTAFDTRPVVAEQVRSLGAKFLEIDLGDTGQTAQGYANALTPEQMQLQKEGQHKAIAESDIVITTAQLFGRKPPVLVKQDDIDAMRPGSVIVDMAAESGGNVEGTVSGETVEINGVKIVGTGNWPNQVPKDATALYANNLFNLLDDYIEKETGEFNLDLQDDILDGCVIVHEGEIRNETLKNHFNSQKEGS